MAYVSRDPFARTELHKERVYVNTETCRECGQQRKAGKHKQMTYLYQFRSESDGGRKDEILGLFCSRDCMEAYNS